MFTLSNKFLNYFSQKLIENIGKTAIPSLLILGQIPTFPAKDYSNFADWCLNYSRLDSDARNTVKVLVNKSLENNNYSWQEIVDTDKCFAVEKTLSNKESLFFEPDDSITNLAPLATLKNLKELNLERQMIDDLNPLAALGKLEKLNLSRNLISDTTPLGSLKELRELDLSYNLTYFLAPLSSLTKLEQLNIERASVSNVEALNPLIGLKKLKLGSNRINDIQPLSSLYNLEKLDLSGNVLRDISSLASLDGIIELKVENNYIPPEAQICPVEKAIACRDLFNQRTADYSVEEIDIFQRQRQTLERNRRILRQLR